MPRGGSLVRISR